MENIFVAKDNRMMLDMQESRYFVRTDRLLYASRDSLQKCSGST
jgi:hypothetical protein